MVVQRPKLKVGNLEVGRTGFCLICCIDFWILVPSTLAVEGTVNRTCSACHSVITHRSTCPFSHNTCHSHRKEYMPIQLSLGPAAVSDSAHQRLLVELVDVLILFCGPGL